jgi:glycosyltransferase involved in cell wall biosynthesis
VRYAQTYESPARAAAFRAVTLLGELLRSRESRHRAAAAALLRRRSWASLPHARLDPQPGDHPIVAGFTSGSIIIPAHNEATVLARTLAPLAQLAKEGAVEIIVVCNGCTDDTAHVARRFCGVIVVEIDTASKIDAINVGDQTATRWPRLYLDADVRISLPAVRDLLETLSGGDILAARPAASYHTEGASALVDSYYRARTRLTSLQTSLWGAGVYGVSEAGHARFGQFPSVIADDLWIDHFFGADLKTVVETEPVVISTPVTNRALLATLRRVYKGNAEISAVEFETLHTGSGVTTTKSTVLDLIHSAKNVRGGIDAAVYAAFAIAGRLSIPLARGTKWERDDSTRG